MITPNHKYVDNVVPSHVTYTSQNYLLNILGKYYLARSKFYVYHRGNNGAKINRY